MIRGVILVLFWPLLQRWGYGITAREGIVLAWCGQPFHKSKLALQTFSALCNPLVLARAEQTCLVAKWLFGGKSFEVSTQVGQCQGLGGIVLTRQLTIPLPLLSTVRLELLNIGCCRGVDKHTHVRK